MTQPNFSAIISLLSITLVAFLVYQLALSFSRTPAVLNPAPTLAPNSLPTESVPAQNLPYTSPDNKLYLSYPADWRVSDSPANQLAQMGTISSAFSLTSPNSSQTAIEIYIFSQTSPQLEALISCQNQPFVCSPQTISSVVFNTTSLDALGLGSGQILFANHQDTVYLILVSTQPSDSAITDSIINSIVLPDGS